MKSNKKKFIRSLVSAVIFIAVILFVVEYQLPYYIYSPGSADSLDPIVHVEDGYDSEGDMHLVTVSGIQATPLLYGYALLKSHYDIHPLNEVKPEDMSDDAYWQMQLHMMSSSQNAAKVTAYRAANKSVTIENDGVYVLSVTDGMPAADQLEIGDHIIAINGVEIEANKDVLSFVENKNEGDRVDLTIKRDDETLEKSIELAEFPNKPKKIGIGIRLVTDRSVEVSPRVEFDSGNIGGPSAGLMFSLELYDQLTEEDLTRGYQIAGTGEIDFDGNVHRIGGIDKKVIAADDEGCVIFFAPNEHGADDSNYDVAKKTAEETGTDMKIVPVDTFNDALEYLQQLDPK